MAALRCDALQVADGALHALLQLLQVLNLAVLFGGELIGLFAGQALALRSERLAHLAFEGLLAARQLVGLARQVFHLVGGFLAAHAGEHLLGFLQALGRAARLRLALRRSRLLRRGGAAHVVHGLVQAVQHLLHLLRARAADAVLLLLHGALLRRLLLALLLALLPCWPCCC